MTMILTNYEDNEYGFVEQIGFEVVIKTEEGSCSVSFSNGEPEDFSMGRDLNDAYSIPTLVELAYKAGKNGEDLIITDESGD